MENISLPAKNLLLCMADDVQRQRMSPDEFNLAALLQLKVSLDEGGIEAVHALPELLRDAIAEAINFIYQPTMTEPAVLGLLLLPVHPDDPTRAAKLAALNAVAQAYADTLDAAIQIATDMEAAG